MGISQDTIDRDLALQALVAEGERANTSLGELRYEACITGGASYTEYADAVGVSDVAVRRSCVRYAQSNGLSMEVPNPVRNPLGGRPRNIQPVASTTPRPPAERMVGTELREELPGGAIGTLRVAIQQTTQMALLLRQYARPTPDETEAFVNEASECIATLQALITHARGGTQ